MEMYEIIFFSVSALIELLISLHVICLNQLGINYIIIHLSCMQTINAIVNKSSESEHTDSFINREEIIIPHRCFRCTHALIFSILISKNPTLGKIFDNKIIK